ncbi:MAG TPA: hypothetical protein VKY74_16370 [Chloroflexia bacterium]|nr:hypothetical protein [Chloroflexia bacterium]
MKYGILVLGALMLLGLGLATSRPADARPVAQAAATPQTGTGGGGTLQGAGGAGIVGQAPDNLVGREPNDAVGYFPAACLSIGILAALIGAYLATSRDARKAAAIRRGAKVRVER